MSTIRQLFANSIDRTIDGVIKADDIRHLEREVDEYVITKEVAPRLNELLEEYIEGDATNGVWISGFFGSGKSHLLKMLSLLLEDRELSGTKVSESFKSKTDDEFLAGNMERAALDSKASCRGVSGRTPPPLPCLPDPAFRRTPTRSIRRGYPNMWRRCLPHPTSEARGT